MRPSKIKDPLKMGRYFSKDILNRYFSKEVKMANKYIYLFLPSFLWVSALLSQ